MIIDFHTHVFPDAIAQRTIAHLEEKGGILFSQQYAKQLKRFLKDQELPWVVSDKSEFEFGASYYADSKDLNWNFIINETRYFFTIRFDEVTPNLPEGKIVQKDVALAQYQFDLFQCDGWLVGSYLHDTANVTVKIRTESKDLISFDAFKFVMIADPSLKSSQ